MTEKKTTVSAADVLAVVERINDKVDDLLKNHVARHGTITKDETGIMRYDFGAALALLKTGKSVAREDWRGRGRWLSIGRPDEGVSKDPTIVTKTPDGTTAPWLATAKELLAEDWIIVRVATTSA